MKKYFFLILLAIMVTLSSCDDEVFCNTGILYGDLHIKLTINDENPEVFLVVYEGKFEKTDTIISEWVDQSNVTYEMESNRYYSATAWYTSGAKQILAIDGKKMDIASDEDGCDRSENITLRLTID